MARILIVDDRPEIRRLVKRTLKKGDHEIVGELSDRYAAASEVEQLNPDIVIMDHKMPIIDGEQATRPKRLYPHVVVIGFTSGGTESGNALLAAGADVCFRKDDLSALQSYLGERG